MANAAKGEATVRLSDGRELTLAYDFDALCAVEEAADRSIGKILGELGEGAPRLSTARALIFGGLQKHHPNMTLADAGELILSEGEAVTNAMQQALVTAFPKQAEGGNGAVPPKRRSGIGSHSSKNGPALA